jgi:thiamine-phosphate pyrophosphorylase
VDDSKLLRLIDANVDRVQEGLRLLEDVARFMLDEAALSEALKALRHSIGGEVASSYGKLLSGRRVAEDVGASLNPPTEMERANLQGLIAANAKRVEESLRVLEEVAKLPDLNLNAGSFKEMRFQLYDLERKLVDQVSRTELRAKLHGLYVIVDPEISAERDLVEVARRAIAGDARLIQLRDKVHDKGDQLETAIALRRLADETGTLFIVNDHIDLTIASDAHGVHLGQTDLPVAVARRLLPLGKIVGCSAQTVEMALQAEADGADYVGVGVFSSSTKVHAERFENRLDRLRKIKDAVSIPVCAISGITIDNVDSVLEAGADMVAVIRAVVGQPDVKAAARALADRIEKADGRSNQM